eukprot:12928354-Prorocentrum_lima.AAC.1
MIGAVDPDVHVLLIQETKICVTLMWKLQGLSALLNAGKHTLALLANQLMVSLSGWSGHPG